MTHNTITLYSTSSRLGWKCPECRACHAPEVAMCERCAPPYYGEQAQPNPYPYGPYEPSRTIPPNQWHGPWEVISK